MYKPGWVPNGNPTPGPKYEYKLAWMARMEARAREPDALVHDLRKVDARLGDAPELRERAAGSRFAS